MRDDVVALAFIAFVALILCGFGYLVADAADRIEELGEELKENKDD